VTGPAEPPGQAGGRPASARGTPAAPSSARGYTYGGPAFVGGILVGMGLGILLGDFGA
jgi:hypothetical protein